MNRMKRLMLISAIFASRLFSQNAGGDTAKARYADSLIQLANTVFYSNPDSSLYYCSLALDYSIKNRLDVQKAKAWHAQAKSEVLRGDIELALDRLKNAAAIFEKHHVPRYVAKCYGLMAIAVGKINNNRQGIEFLQKAVSIYREVKDTAGLTAALVNLSSKYMKVSEPDKALEVLNESKRYTRAGNSDWYYYYVNAGSIHLMQKNYKQAKADFDSCITISRRHKMMDAEVTAITKMAELYFRTQRFGEAIAYFNQAIRMSRDNLLPIEESEALEDLIHCYEATGNYRDAFLCQNRLKTISDSLFNIEKVKNISTIETRLRVSEKEKTIALQKLHMEKSAAAQEQSRKRIQLLIAGACILAVILFFTAFVYVRTRRQKREVELQKMRAERLNSLNQKIFAVIAHDFKSPMITLNMLIDLMDKEGISREDLGAYSADVRNQIIQSGQILDNLLNWARTELNLSRSGNLKSAPFLVAGEIAKELGYMSSRKNVVIRNDVPASVFLKIPPDILRIILRNLLSNAVKFSYSDSTVTIGCENGNTVVVKDNGAGIPEATMNRLFNGTVQSRLGTFNETGFGLGLYITYELIQKFNGKIIVEKNNPSGTVFKFVLPV